MKRILGIDQSLRFSGICIIEGEYLIFHDIIQTTEDKNDKLDVFKRSDVIAEKIAEIAVDYSIDKVNIEGISFGSTGDATRKLAILQGLIVNKLIQQEKEVNIIAPPSLKKFATNNGRAKKEEIFSCLPETIQVTFSAYPKTKGRFDLADAYWLARYE